MAIQKLSRKDIKEHIEDGYVHVNILYEMIGSPKEHIDKTLKLFLENIDSDKQIITISEDIEETVALEGGMFSAAAEVEYLIEGIEKLTWLAFNFMPANIEIKAPKELTFMAKDFSGWLNDLLAKLHEVNTAHTRIRSEHQALVKNLNAAIRNNILLALDEPMTSAQISKNIGMNSKQVLLFLEALIKEDKIKKKGTKYEKK